MCKLLCKVDMEDWYTIHRNGTASIYAGRKIKFISEVASNEV